MAVEMPCWSERYTKEELFELVNPNLPYYRYFEFPVEVTVEIEVIAKGEAEA